MLAAFLPTSTIRCSVLACDESILNIDIELSTTCIPSQPGKTRNFAFQAKPKKPVSEAILSQRLGTQVREAGG